MPIGTLALQSIALTTPSALLRATPSVTRPPPAPATLRRTGVATPRNKPRPGDPRVAARLRPRATGPQTVTATKKATTAGPIQTRLPYTAITLTSPDRASGHRQKARTQPRQPRRAWRRGLRAPPHVLGGGGAARKPVSGSPSKAHSPVGVRAPNHKGTNATATKQGAKQQQPLQRARRAAGGPWQGPERARGVATAAGGTGGPEPVLPTRRAAYRATVPARGGASAEDPKPCLNGTPHSFWPDSIAIRMPHSR